MKRNLKQKDKLKVICFLTYNKNEINKKAQKKIKEIEEALIKEKLESENLMKKKQEEYEKKINELEKKINVFI